MEYIPGAVAYFIGGFLIWASKTFIWKITNHWSKIWVADASQASSQVLSLTFVLTGLLLGGIGLFIWSLANHINYKNTEKGFIANLAGGIGIATAFGQDLWLNQIATSLTTYTD
jgi:hypothetical protein